jgi:hypothetical protein
MYVFSNSRAFPGLFNPWAARGTSVNVMQTAATFINYMTEWLEHCPSAESNKSLSQEIPGIYGTRRFITTFTRARYESLSCARSIQSMPPPPDLWRYILILFSHFRLGFFFHSGFQLKPCMHLSSSPYMLHVWSISFSIWSPEYFVVSTDRKAPRYKVFFVSLLSRPSSNVFLGTLTVYVPPSMCETKFHTHKKNRQMYNMLWNYTS